MLNVTIAFAAVLIQLLAMFWCLVPLGVFCRRGGHKTGESVRVRIRETGQIFDMSQCERCKRIEWVPVQSS